MSRAFASRYHPVPVDRLTSMARSGLYVIVFLMIGAAPYLRKIP